jgi:hypothetical protein
MPPALSCVSATTMSEPSAWISVGDLATAFQSGAYRLRTVEPLLGRTLALHLENRGIVDFTFEANSQLTWSGIGLGIEKATAPYEATEIRPGIVFVDFMPPHERATAVSLILDLRKGIGICTALLGRLPTAEEARTPLCERLERNRELTGVTATFLAGAIDRSFTEVTPRHALTCEMLGKLIEYSYSPSERYQHLYLNENLYSWHCLEGAEKGLADTDRCCYRKLSDRLYLFVWREKIVPTLGVVIVDLEQMKTTGKIFGYRDFRFDAESNFAIGAWARIVSSV